MQSQWNYSERIETKITPPMFEAVVAVAKLEGLSVSELIRRALVAEIKDQYPGIASRLAFTERVPAGYSNLQAEIAYQIEQMETYSEHTPDDVPWR